MIFEVLGHTPQVSESAWIAKNATVSGRVAVGENSSIWFQCVVRGDVNAIIIGKNSNIQDASILHGSTGKQNTIIGDNVTVGHRAIIHGCVLESNCLIGMGAIVLDDAIVPSNTIIAAGAVVSPGKHLESGWLYAGIPAKKLRPLTEQEITLQISLTAQHYVEAAKVYSRVQYT